MKFMDEVGDEKKQTIDTLFETKFEIDFTCSCSGTDISRIKLESLLRELTDAANFKWNSFQVSWVLDMVEWTIDLVDLTKFTKLSKMWRWCPEI